MSFYKVIKDLAFYQCPRCKKDFTIRTCDLKDYHITCACGKEYVIRQLPAFLDEDKQTDKIEFVITAIGVTIILAIIVTVIIIY